MSRLAVVKDRTYCVIDGVYTQNYEQLKAGEVVMLIKEDTKVPEDLARAASYSDSSGISFQELLGKFHLVLTKNKLVYIQTTKVTPVFPNASLKDMVVAITGALSYSREFYVALIEAYGGVYKPSFTKGVTHVVVGEIKTTSAKLTNAKKFGITCLAEKDFWAMIRETKT